MNSFGKNILNKLIDKYEKSKLSKGGTKVSKSVTLTPKDDVLKTYSAFDSYKYIDENDAILKELVSLGFIKTKYEKGHFVSLTLVLDSVNDIYVYLKRNNPKEEIANIRKLLSRYSFGNFVDDFINYINVYIEDRFDYPKTYFSNFEQLENILFIFSKLFELQTEMKKRDFSARYLGNSKLFENYENRIIRIIKDFDGNDYMDDEEVLQNYNITKNSTYALIKNGLTAKINDCIIDLDELKCELSLSDEMIDLLEIIDLRAKKLITIENLTSFYSIKDKNSIIIYLGGYHNHTKQMLLRKIYNRFPHLEYYHFGDIDVGGFWIYMTLLEKTKIPFKPFKMGVAELIDNKNHLMKLTENDKIRLEKMLVDIRFESFKDIIKYMLVENCKLEQENIIVKEYI